MFLPFRRYQTELTSGSAAAAVTHPVAVPDADDPGVVGAAVVQRVDPNLATAAAPPLATASLAEAAEAQAIRISCFGREGRKESGNGEE